MNQTLKRIITGIILIICLYYFFSLFILSSLLYILLYEWPKLANTFNGFYKYIFTIFYPVLPFWLIILLQNSGYKQLNFLLFALCFAHDTGSYIFGKLFGKTKIYPSISPGKAIEGCIGGFLFVNAISFLFFRFDFNIFIKFILPFNILVTILALSGDLFESYLKRKAGIKDSGSILPGHGGLLDRFDSILFVVFIIYLFRKYLITLL